MSFEMLLTFLQTPKQTDDTGCFLGMVAVIGVFVILIIISNAKEKNRLAKLSPKERAELERIKRNIEQDKALGGGLNPSMICPHCQAKGSVRTQRVKQKKGISGGKATAALLTGGASLLAVGLSKKGEVTQAKCDNCHCQWSF